MELLLTTGFLAIGTTSSGNSIAGPPNNACPSADNKGADQRETMIKQIKPVAQQDLMTEAKIIKEYSNPIDKEVTNIDTLGNKQ